MGVRKYASLGGEGTHATGEEHLHGEDADVLGAGHFEVGEVAVDGDGGGGLGDVGCGDHDCKGECDWGRGEGEGGANL